MKDNVKTKQAKAPQTEEPLLFTPLDMPSSQNGERKCSNVYDFFELEQVLNKSKSVYKGMMKESTKEFLKQFNKYEVNYTGEGMRKMIKCGLEGKALSWYEAMDGILFSDYSGLKEDFKEEFKVPNELGDQEKFWQAVIDGTQCADIMAHYYELIKLSKKDVKLFPKMKETIMKFNPNVIRDKYMDCKNTGEIYKI